MKRIVLALKGVLFGIANVIPGVSGGTIALITGVFDKLMESIGNFFKKGIGREKRLEYFWFLVTFGIGVGIGILGFAKLMTFLLEHGFKQPLYLCFAGLIAGSVPFIVNLKPNMKPGFGKLAMLVLGFALVLGLTLVSGKREGTANKNPLYTVVTVPADGTLAPGISTNADRTGTVYTRVPAKPGYLLSLAFYGFVGSVAMILPGFSGSALMVAVGQYDNIMFFIDRLDVVPLAFFAIGILAGILLAAKAITWCLEKFPPQTMYFILGLVLASLVQIGIVVVPGFSLKAGMLVLSIVTFAAGFAGAYLLGRIDPETLKAEK